MGGKEGVDRITTLLWPTIANLLSFYHKKEITQSWADSGNRTRVFSLAKRNFTIQPYPHFFILDTCIYHIYPCIPLDHICAVPDHRLSSE